MDQIPTAQTNPFPEEKLRELCSNCGKKMAKKGKYCPHCGQERFDGRVTFRDLSKKFLQKLTNLDNKMLRMMWHLLIPARVTKDHFAGKIKQYPHPFQFFFVVSFFCVLVFSKTVDTSSGVIKIHVNTQESEVNIKSAETSKQFKDQKNLNLFFQMERYVFGREILGAYDSLPASLRSPVVKASLDSILQKTNGRWVPMIDSLLKEGKSKDSLDLKLINQQFRIALKDIVEHTPEEITEIYGISDWMSKILLKQGIRSIQDPSDLISAYIGSFSWTILALIFVMSFCLSLFYWPQKRYFVEHFVLLMHLHSGVFLILTFILVFNYYLPLKEYWGIVMGGVSVFLLLTMKWYYGQNWFWTGFKWFWFLLFYTLGFAILFVLGLLVVFTVF
ncbi:DUF3667 domain-containing protein [Haliscomenobacter sp.]|uniref:DUF3667 domain-containing protein n=1 Tax=Haliscomenobacter sp. TaxID=2717303 RepID=UPI003364E596